MSFTPDLLSMNYKDFDKFVPLDDGDKAVVIKVYDGDTLTIGFRHGHNLRPVRQNVRIRGIDTPELKTKVEKEKELALLAKTRLKEVTMGKVVTILSPTSDKYGRLLCDLSTEQLNSVASFMLQEKEFCREYQGGKRQPWTSFTTSGTTSVTTSTTSVST